MKKKTQQRRLRAALASAPSVIPVGSTLDLMLGTAIPPPSAFEQRWGRCIAAAEWAREWAGRYQVVE